MKTLFTLALSSLLPVLGLAQFGGVVRSPMTTNSVTGTPSANYVPFWNGTAWVFRGNNPQAASLYLNTTTILNSTNFPRVITNWNSALSTNMETSIAGATGYIRVTNDGIYNIALNVIYRQGTNQSGFRTNMFYVATNLGSAGTNLTLVGGRSMAQSSNIFYNALTYSGNVQLVSNTYITAIYYNLTAPPTNDLAFEFASLSVNQLTHPIGGAGSGGGAALTDGDKGEITVASSGSSWTIDTGVITPTKVNVDILTNTFSPDLTINSANALFNGIIKLPGGAGSRIENAGSTRGSTFIATNSVQILANRTNGTIISSATGITTNANQIFYYETNQSSSLSNLIAARTYGDVVQLGAGDFNVEMQSIVIPVGVTVKGMGKGSTVIKGKSILFTNGAVFTLNSSNKLENLTIDLIGSSSNYMGGFGFQHTLGQKAATNAYIRNVEILNAQSDGIYFVHSNFYSVFIDNVKVRSKFDAYVQGAAPVSGFDTCTNCTNYAEIWNSSFISDNAGATHPQTIASGRCTALQAGSGVTKAYNSEFIATNANDNYATLALGYGKLYLNSCVVSAAGTNNSRKVDNFTFAVEPSNNVFIANCAIDDGDFEPGGVGNYYDGQFYNITGQQLVLAGSATIGGDLTASTGTVLADSLVGASIAHIGGTVTEGIAYVGADNYITNTIYKLRLNSPSAGQALKFHDATTLTNDSLAGSGTMTTVKSNGVNISTAVSSIDFITGSNSVVRATNTAGAVTVQINAAAGGGSGTPSGTWGNLQINYNGAFGGATNSWWTNDSLALNTARIPEAYLQITNISSVPASIILDGIIGGGHQRMALRPATIGSETGSPKTLWQLVAQGNQVATVDINRFEMPTGTTNKGPLLEYNTVNGSNVISRLHSPVLQPAIYNVTQHEIYFLTNANWTLGISNDTTIAFGNFPSNAICTLTVTNHAGVVTWRESELLWRDVTGSPSSAPVASNGVFRFCFQRINGITNAWTELEPGLILTAGQNTDISTNLATGVVTVSGKSLLTNLSNIKFAVNRISTITFSNLVFSLNTNTYELIGQTNLVLTNVVGMADLVNASSKIYFRPLNSNMTNTYPAFNTAVNGYYWRTNANSPMWTTLTNGKTYVLSMDAIGTNLFSTITEWP